MSGCVYGITVNKCAVCGKKFVPAPMHAYKRKSGRVVLCSYRCMLAYDKEHPPKRQKARSKTYNNTDGSEN